MNESVFTGPATSPRVIYEMLSYIQTLWGSNPMAELRDFASLGFVPSNQSWIFNQNSVRPNAAFLRDEFGVLVLLSGTSGTLHAAQLVHGWENPEEASSGSGVNVAFSNAVASYFAELPIGFLHRDQRVRIVGHSYGGAVGQCLADILQHVELFPNVEVVTIGSPRAGNERFQRRMQRIRHTRWYSEVDPVRWIPPHSNEVPSLLSTTLRRTWRGMDTQVQTPLGRRINDEGVVVVEEGNPTRLHSVILSILQWCFDIEGFRSINHAIKTYQDLMYKAIVAEVPVEVPPTPSPLDRPANISIGESAYWEEQGVLDIVADPTSTQGPGAEVVVVRRESSSRVRYKRKKVGRIWTVQLSGVVVAVGPGKRRARQIARSMNRAAVVTP